MLVDGAFDLEAELSEDCLEDINPALDGGFCEAKSTFEGNGFEEKLGVSCDGRGMGFGIFPPRGGPGIVLPREETFEVCFFGCKEIFIAPVFS